MIIKLLFNTTETMLKDRGLEPSGKNKKIVDSEVLRRSTPYVPFKTGNLIKSGIRGTKIGSGEVMYNAVYAHQLLPKCRQRQTRYCKRWSKGQVLV